MSQMPIFDANRARRAYRTVTKPDGTVAREKVPIQKSVMAVNPAGHIVRMPLYTGPAQFDEDNPYRRAIEVAKFKANPGRSQGPAFIPYGECPQGNHRLHSSLPSNIQGRRPCSTGANGGKVANEDPCACVLATIKERQAKNAAKMAALNAQLETPQERLAKRHVEALEAAQEATEAARAASQPQERRGK